MRRPSDSLTAQQRDDVVRSPWDARLLVTAGPGTGKTHSLIRRLEFLIEEQGLEADEILVLSFSRAAIREIKDRLKADASRAQDIDVRTFDSYATWLLSEVDPDGAWQQAGYNGRIRAAVEAITRDDAANDLVTVTRHLVVDEIQDLVEDRAELVKALLTRVDGGFTLLGDPAQGIYGFQMVDVDKRVNGTAGLFEWIRSIYDDELQVVTLVENHRARSGQARTAETFGPLISTGHADYATIVRDLRTTLMTDGDYLGTLDEAALVLDGAGPSTAVLCRNNGEALLISRGLHRLGIRHRLARSAEDRVVPAWVGAVFLNVGDRRRPPRDRVLDALKEIRTEMEPNPDEMFGLLKMMDNGIRSSASLDLSAVERRLARGGIPDEIVEPSAANLVVSTIHRVKGREFDRVVIVDFGDPTDDPVEQAELSRLLYVAMTRPRDRLCWIDRVTPQPGHNLTKNGGGRWFEAGFGKNRWHRYGMELRGNDVHPSDPAGTVGPPADPAKLQGYLRSRVPSDSPVTLDRLNDEQARYAIWHDDTAIGVTSDSFVEALRRVFPGGKARRLPRRITGPRVETIETVTGSEASSINAGLGSFGVWLRPRLYGLGRFDWQED